MNSDFEKRLETLREEARINGRVRTGEAEPVQFSTQGSPGQSAAGMGYYGQPVIKPPVWEWMIPVYFFIGGTAGMSALVALGAWLKGQYDLARAAMWLAGTGAVLSPILLVADLGRPLRFLYMLRVFKYRSPMSLGSWILTAFGTCAIPGLFFTEWRWQNLHAAAAFSPPLWIPILLVAGAALAGVFLATYTGALLAVTTIPAWNLHRVLLPFHFGIAGLGAASGIMELAGFSLPALHAIGFFAAAAQTLVMLWSEFVRHGAADRALHEGRAGWLLRSGEACEGPLALIFRVFGFSSVAAALFVLGALVSRFGWVSAGKACALDPEAIFASQRPSPHQTSIAQPYWHRPKAAPSRKG